MLRDMASRRRKRIVGVLLAVIVALVLPAVLFHFFTAFKGHIRLSKGAHVN